MSKNQSSCIGTSWFGEGIVKPRQRDPSETLVTIYIDFDVEIETSDAQSN